MVLLFPERSERGMRTRVHSSVSLILVEANSWASNIIIVVLVCHFSIFVHAINISTIVVSNMFFPLLLIGFMSLFGPFFKHCITAYWDITNQCIDHWFIIMGCTFRCLINCLNFEVNLIPSALFLFSLLFPFAPPLICLDVLCH